MNNRRKPDPKGICRSLKEERYNDLHYVDHWSLAFDFEILMKTVPAVLSGRGAV